MTMQKAVALAHLRVAYEPEDDDEIVSIPAPPASPPQYLPVPSAWWETPAVTSRPLSPVPEEARTARQFVRELLTCWGLGYLIDDAELIIAELVVNAVRHGLRTTPQVVSPATTAGADCRSSARSATSGAGRPSKGTAKPSGPSCAAPDIP